MAELQQNHSKIELLYEQQIRRSQDIILDSLEKLLPQDFNFLELAKIFEEGHQSSSIDILSDLIKYFVRCIFSNFIYIKDYQLLEQQTQKLETVIRSHIKIQQEMKMYMEHLEAQVLKYQSQLHYNKPQKQASEFLLMETKKSQAFLMKQKINLMKEKDALMKELEIRNQKIKNLQSTNFSFKQKQGFMFNLQKRTNSVSQEKQKFIIHQKNDHGHLEFNTNHYILTKKDYENNRKTIDESSQIHKPNTQIPNTQIPNTQIPNTQIPNTQIPNTQILNNFSKNKLIFQENPNGFHYAQGNHNANFVNFKNKSQITNQKNHVSVQSNLQNYESKIGGILTDRQKMQQLNQNKNYHQGRALQKNVRTYSYSNLYPNGERNKIQMNKLQKTKFDRGINLERRFIKRDNSNPNNGLLWERPNPHQIIIKVNNIS